MRYVLIGCGRIAQRHLPAAQSAGLEVAGLCDLDIRRAVRLAGEAGEGGKILPTYDDYKTMIERVRPDIAAIATDSGSHAAIAIHCLERGIPVIIEKPIALSSADADRICRLSFEMGVPVAVCHQNRFNPAVRALKGAVDAGELGRLHYASAAVRWHRGADYYASAPWRGRYRTDGGVLMNQCIHAADVLIHLLGCPLTVAGLIDRRERPIEAEDFGAALIRFEGGQSALFEGTGLIEPQNLEETVFVAGSGGSARLGGVAMNTLTRYGTGEDDGDTAEAVADVYGGGHRLLYADMVHAVTEGESPAVTAEDGRLALELILAIYRSAREGGAPVGFMASPFAAADMAHYFDNV